MLLMGKSTISMVIFNSFLYVHQRVQTIMVISVAFWVQDLQIGSEILVIDLALSAIHGAQLKLAHQQWEIPMTGWWLSPTPL